MTARWRAPGRINLIGEHTDYNDGFVLPFAIGLGCTATVQRTDDALVRVSSAQRSEQVQLPGTDLRPGTVQPAWAAYVVGAVWAMQADLPAGAGVRISVDSDVPVGAGLSSSAALVCSVATALDEEFGCALTSARMLQVTRRVENDFVGAPTGGMDQLAVLRSQAGHVLFCDMRTLESEAVPFELGPLALLVVDTRAEHSHADGEYRRRRSGCEAAAAALGVPALRDIAIGELDTALARLTDDELRRYTRHIVTENDRVLRTVQLLRGRRVDAIGPLLSASHASMRDDFRITGPELDLAAETLEAHGALGARMTGGGFGGCVIALVRRDQVDGSTAQVIAAFAAAGFRAPTVFTAEPADGAHRLQP